MAKSISPDEYQVICKYDHQLNLTEINDIFLVYNECFYDDQLVRPDHIQTAKLFLGKKKLWQWYFAITKKGKQIIAIANFVYDHSNIGKLSVRADMGENLTSVGTLKAYQGNGISRVLVERIIADHGAKDLVVEIKKVHPYVELGRIVGFYQSFGFVKQVEEEEVLFLRRAGTAEIAKI
jgi:GNAT superfamily N-acetyltransferase